MHINVVSAKTAICASPTSVLSAHDMPVTSASSRRHTVNLMRAYLITLLISGSHGEANKNNSVAACLCLVEIDSVQGLV